MSSKIGRYSLKNAPPVETAIPSGQWTSIVRPGGCPTCKGSLQLYQEDGRSDWKCSMCGRLEHPPVVAPMKPRAVFHGYGRGNKINGKGHGKKGVKP